MKNRNSQWMFYKTIPVTDFILSNCKLKTCNCTKMDTFKSIKVFDCKCTTAARESLSAGTYFCRTPLHVAFEKLTTNVYHDWHITGVQPNIFQSRGLSWTKGISINISPTTDKRQASQEKSSKVFLLDTLTTAFKINLIHGWTESELFSQNQGSFFNFQKISPLPTLVAPLHYHLFPLFTYQVSQFAQQE